MGEEAWKGKGRNRRVEEAGMSDSDSTPPLS